MKTTGRLLALALVSSIALSACTGGDEETGDETGPTGTAGTGATGATLPTPPPTFSGAPGTSVYTYANAGLLVTADFAGNEGTLTVENGTDDDLEGPGLYVLDAADGHEIDGEVASPEPIPAGETATFDVSIEGIRDARDIGLLVLLFGSDNYGAFVRTG
ncbi:MAG TPA: hypothetical protein VIC58_01230 [Actinomycetota bacterium]